MKDKYQKLRTYIRELGSVVVAFSGGTDSALVLKVCLDELGVSKTLAVTAQSPSLPQGDLVLSKAFTTRVGINHVVVETQEMTCADYVANSSERCFHCKHVLYKALCCLANKSGFEHVVSGVNADDLGDFRPGIRAGEVFAVKNPLVEAGLGKEDVRALSKMLKLETWNKPAAACLASRIPYGTPITAEGLVKVDKAEEVLRDLGFLQVRVRNHDPVARVEIASEEFYKILNPEIQREVVRGIKAAGFQYVSLDLEGFRSGSMNEVLP